MAGTVPARAKMDRQGFVTPQAEKEQEETVCGLQRDGLCLDSYLFISSLPYPVPSMGRTRMVATLVSRTGVIG